MFRKRSHLFRGRVALLIYTEKSPLHGVQITNRNQGDAGIIPFYLYNNHIWTFLSLQPRNFLHNSTHQDSMISVGLFPYKAYVTILSNTPSSRPARARRRGAGGEPAVPKSSNRVVRAWGAAACSEERERRPYGFHLTTTGGVNYSAEGSRRRAVEHRAIFNSSRRDSPRPNRQFITNCY